MDGRERFNKAMREAGVGAAAALSLLALFARGSAGLVEFAYLVLAIGVAWWITTVPVARLSGRRGRPRLVVFASLAGLAGVGALSLAVLAEPLIALAVAVLSSATGIGMWRVVRPVL